MARIGIMGGTYNPPHNGHLLCASEAADQLQLDSVIWMPAGTPPHKQVAPGSPTAQQRAELCRLATSGDPRMSVSTLELEREGRSYTVDTLRTLRLERPGDELVFIIGADSALSFPTWKEPEQICELAHLGIAGRDGVLQRDIVGRLAGLPAHLEFFDMPRFDVSSSEVRRRLARGQGIDYLVPSAVKTMLQQEGFYR